MSSFIQKIRKASHARSTYHFTPAHLQSAEFMQNNVIFSKYVVPTDHFKIQPVFEGRCAALINPAFINTEYHVRGFYVPHNIVWKRFDDFVNGNHTLRAGVHINTKCPYVTDKGLTQLIITYASLYEFNGSTTLTLSDVQNNDFKNSCDFIVEGSTASTYLGYRLSNEGRFVYKLLRSLGYKFNFTLDDLKSEKMNAFPLLSYMRIYVDYFVPSLFYNVSACNILLSKVYDASTDYDLTGTLVDMKNVFDELYQNYYPSDYLTASWNQPQSPLGTGLDNDYAQTGNLTDLSQFLTEVDGNTTSTIKNRSQSGVQSTSMSTSSASENGLSSFGNPWVQRNLQKIADWLTRTRFSGTDKLINILTRFGVKPSNELALRSKMVGHFTQPLVVQDINATSDTYDSTTQQGLHLGEYAGKMFTQAQGNKTFEFDADDYGCIIITSMITPHEIHYFEGIERDVMKMNPLEFFQPEFDSMGTQLQSRRELISGLQFDIPQAGMANWLYQLANGYIPRYSEYKTAYSNISGDFMVNHLNKGTSSFHHFRSFAKYGKFKGTSMQTALENSLVPNTGNVDDVNTVSLASTPTLLQANSNLLIRAQDKQQYNRIFNVTDANEDHIYTMYYFNITASRPMKPISDSIDVEDGTNEKVDVSKPVVENFK